MSAHIFKTNISNASQWSIFPRASDSTLIENKRSIHLQSNQESKKLEQLMQIGTHNHEKFIN